MTPQLFRTGMMCACVRMLSSSVMSDSPQSCLQPTRLLCPWDSPEKNTGVGHRFLLQGIFLTQGSKPNLSCFLHWRAGSLPLEPQRGTFTFNSVSCREPGAVVGDPTHDKVRGEDLTHTRPFRTQGTLQVGPGLYPTLYPPPLLLLFLFALLQILVLPALESSPAPLSLIKDQLKTLIKKSPGRWYPMKGPGMKEMLQFKPFC